MSLKLRLTLTYTGLLSGVVLLLSIVVYSMISVLMVNQVDALLQNSADELIRIMRVDAIGEISFTREALIVSPATYYQVWSDQDGIIYHSENASDFPNALDPDAVTKKEPLFREVTLGESSFRVLTVPLTSGQNYIGALQVGIIFSEVQHTQRLLQLVFGVSALFAIIVAGAVGWLVTTHALGPLETINRVASRITDTDDLSLRIPINSNRTDEVSQLVLTFNQTLVRLEGLFNTQRRFLADVSHELRTPLTVIKGNIGLMRIMHEVDEESLDSIESEVNRLTRLVEDLLLMAQAETGRLPLMLELVELDGLLFEVFEQMKILSEGMHQIIIEEIEPVVVSGDRDRLKQVLLNLGTNAIKFTPENGIITLSLSQKSQWVSINFTDQGPGIEKRERRYLFERFYRGDKSRSRTEKNAGFGLGLSIAYWIIRNHGGWIDVESEVGIGTSFIIWLPISQSEIPTQPARNPREKKK